MEELERLIDIYIAEEEETIEIPMKEFGEPFNITEESFEILYSKNFEGTIAHFDDARDDMELYGSDEFENWQYKIASVTIHPDKILVEINWDV